MECASTCFVTAFQPSTQRYTVLVRQRSEMRRVRGDRPLFSFPILCRCGWCFNRVNMR
ncbi:hypothetical protein V8C34DRAFT_278448 [Trichoderma compactum]